MFAMDGDAWWRKVGEDSLVVKERIIENIKTIVLKCNKEKQALILCSILPSDIAPPYKKDERNQMIIDVNLQIKEICNENELLYVDYHLGMVQKDGRTLIYEYSPDGIHPSAEGYKVMASILHNQLKKITK